MDPTGGLPSRRPPVPTLPQNPGYSSGPGNNIRQSWLSEDIYSIIHLKAAANVNRTTLNNADFKAHSRPERKLIETTTSAILQMKWKRTFSTTT